MIGKLIREEPLSTLKTVDAPKNTLKMLYAPLGTYVEIVGAGCQYDCNIAWIPAYEVYAMHLTDNMVKIISKN